MASEAHCDTKKATGSLASRSLVLLVAFHVALSLMELDLAMPPARSVLSKFPGTPGLLDLPDLRAGALPPSPRGRF